MENSPKLYDIYVKKKKLMSVPKLKTIQAIHVTPSITS